MRDLNPQIFKLCSTTTTFVAHLWFVVWTIPLPWVFTPLGIRHLVSTPFAFTQLGSGLTSALPVKCSPNLTNYIYIISNIETHYKFAALTNLANGPYYSFYYFWCIKSPFVFTNPTKQPIYINHSDLSMLLSKI